MPAVTFRAASLSDFAGIAACLSRNDLSVPTEAEWGRLWDSHPYASDFRDVPRGFVLEADGIIVGTIFNLWAKYSLDGRDLRVAISGSAAVDPAHRGGSIKLMGETVRQPGVDIYLNGSPSEVAAKIMDALKVRRVPQASYDVSLLWAARGRGLALAALRRRKVPLAPALALPAGAAVSAISRLKLRRMSGNGCPVAVAPGFSDEFDGLWTTLRSQTKRLIAFRNRAMLEWRYSSLLKQDRARLLVVRRDGELAGYAVLLRSSRPNLGLEQYAIHDIQCLNDDPGLTASLIRAAFRETRLAGLDLLEWVGHTGQRRATAETGAAFRYQLNVWQAYYYTRDPILKSELAAPDRWSFGLYDSD